MKRKLMSVLSALMLATVLTVTATIDARAGEVEPRQVDGSYLTHEDESIGYAIPLTRGASLQQGFSKIVKMGPGVVYAGGSTFAQQVVELVQVSVMLERCKGDDGKWEVVDMWQKTNADTDLVSANRRVEVDGGWYYRVRSIHRANSDVSASFTDGIFIEKP